MARFSNGTEGMIFVAENCDYCANWKERSEDYPASSDTQGCPIWDAHILYQPNAAEESDLSAVLDLLIQDTPKGPRCNLFVPESKQALAEQEGQIRLLDERDAEGGGR